MISTFDFLNFRQRLMSGFLLAPIVLLLIWIGGWFYIAAVMLCVMLALREWLVLVPTAQLHVKVVATILLFAMVAAALRPSPVLLLAFLVFYGLDLYFWSLQGDFKKSSAIGITLGLFALAAGGFSLVYLRMLPVIGAELACFLFAVVWGTDIGGYVAGNLVGGPKLAPAISPNKTWAGFFGGIALAIIFGCIIVLLFRAGHIGIAVFLAVLLALTAQAGDLCKSIFKRRAGVKDSGHLIPGHGGMLDRIDGLLFAATFFTLFEMIMGKGGGWW
jgi:phosphatidate cytidylyltransferase